MPKQISMPKVTLATGAVCVLLGLGLAYGAHLNGKNPVTAMIPAFVGILWIVMGAIAGVAAKARKHIMHLLAALALLLALSGLGMGLPKIIQYAADPSSIPVEKVRPLAWWGQVALSGVMSIFLVLCVKSFIAARRARS